MEIFLAVYKVPGEYAIGALLAFAFANTMDFYPVGVFVLRLVGVIFLVVEICIPFYAGFRIYKMALKWLSNN